MLNSVFRNVVASIITASTIIFPITAHADLNICNRHSEKITAAIVLPVDSKWVTRGWYHVEPGKCVTPIRGKLKNQQYWYHAKTESGKIISGDGWGCAKSERMQDVHQKDCKGDYKKLFKEIWLENLDEHFTQYVNGTGDSYVSILPSEISRLNSQMRPNQSTKNNNNDGGGLLLGLAVIGGLIWSLDAQRKNEEDACMRRCTHSKSRCYELCTQ